MYTYVNICLWMCIYKKQMRAARHIAAVWDSDPMNAALSATSWVSVCAKERVWVYRYIHMYVNMCIHMHIYPHMHMHIHRYAYIYIHVYVYEYIHVIYYYDMCGGFCIGAGGEGMNGSKLTCHSMGWLRLVWSIKWYVSFAKEPYKRN